MTPGASRGTITAANGGSISATAADGTVFTLEVPANAIFSDQEVVMTPARATGSFPFRGGLAAGVDLKPGGLILLTGARLTIHTPTSIPLSEETPVAWNGSGEDFFLFPPDPAGGDLSMQIFHLGGYGVAGGTDAEREAQLLREPLADNDVLTHRISPLLRAARGIHAAARGIAPRSTADWRADLKSYLNLVYDAVRTRMLAYDGEPRAVLSLINQALQWRAAVERYLGPLDTEFPGRADEIHSLFTQMMKKALHVAHERCSANVSAADQLPSLIALSGLLALDVQLDINEAVRCLTFRLRFKSTITQSVPLAPGVSPTDASETIRADVTFRTTTNPFRTSGQGTVNFTAYNMSNPGLCSYTHTSSPGRFTGVLSWRNLSSGDGPLQLNSLDYDVAVPVEVQCHVSRGGAGLPPGHLAKRVLRASR